MFFWNLFVAEPDSAVLDLVETNFGFTIEMPAVQQKEGKKDDSGESSAMKQNDNLKKEVIAGRSKLFNNDQL